MKTMILLSGLIGLTITAGCHAHQPKKVVVVNKGHKHSKVVLVDNDHRRKDYTIVHVKPGKNRVCKKHRKHWHCL